MTTLAASADDTTFVVKNTTRSAIVAVYASPAHIPDWPPKELLPDSDVDAGGAIQITIPDGSCAYDFQFVFDDGRTLEDSTDVCEIGTYVVRP